ncbi:MAG: ornithine carbamoyltransferase, partial [Haloarculaceae archaeon]
MTRDFLDVDDLTTAEIETVLDRAAAIKADEGPAAQPAPLADQTLGMIFEKPSTRTRVSFETGMTRLGGHAIFLGPNDIHLGHGEPVRDTARAVGRYVDLIMARVFDHADVETIGAYADVPVINGLSDDAHPCQALADLLTIRERFGFADTTVAWIGDGNNVAQSFVVGAALVGLDVVVATPDGYGIDEDVLDRAADLGDAPAVVDDPAAAVADADVVYTDVWVSMGEEDERAEKLAAFEGFQVTSGLLGDRPLMHCLPAHRGEEVTDEAIESDNAIVWDQAENRLHAQNGLLVWLN